ncbi:hypothetical protein HUE87_07775 [Candidatus Sulfurimonas marisnigri]|uniref:Uncharacterized protein n=1 Tax=Candidatus Sulfurimonas marisnigri TaxID=2740405 RepID=A0A7S7LYI3_9BACT|nr:hypothetical protein [Candidatus Sulfurimonas marisnigri]QOY53799.1 hypothetical protein HUE87_07775 [Candidatus Sulfurimonas marisnigri]
MQILVLKANSGHPLNKNTIMNGMKGVVAGYKAYGKVHLNDKIRILTDNNRVIHAVVNKVEKMLINDDKVAIFYTQENQKVWDQGWQAYVNKKIMTGMILINENDLPA